MFGNPETTSGGESLKYYASQRLDLRKSNKTEEDGVFVSNTVKAKVVKNKIGPPFRTAEFEIIFGKGIDKYRDLLTMALDEKILARGGAWIKQGETVIAQGEPNAAKYIQEHPDFEKELKIKLGLLEAENESTESID